jgi:hypothetical protein
MSTDYEKCAVDYGAAGDTECLRRAAEKLNPRLKVSIR